MPVQRQSPAGPGTSSVSSTGRSRGGQGRGAQTDLLQDRLGPQGLVLGVVAATSASVSLSGQSSSPSPVPNSTTSSRASHRGLVSRCGAAAREGDPWTPQGHSPGPPRARSSGTQRPERTGMAQLTMPSKGTAGGSGWRPEPEKHLPSWRSDTCKDSGGSAGGQALKPHEAPRGGDPEAGGRGEVMGAAWASLWRDPRT